MIKDAQKYPHGEVIKENATIIVPSIFMLENMETLFAFLFGCSRNNCTVHFANEDITVNPRKKPQEIQAKLIVYMIVHESKEVVEKIFEYIVNRESMKWENVLEVANEN